MEFVDTEQKLSTFKTLQEEFLSVESKLDIPSKSDEDQDYCPSCSGHGKCKEGSKVCTCDSGYTLANCAVKKGTLDAMKSSLSKAANAVIESFNPATITDSELSSTIGII
mmetsp:Transcript_39549/g.35340  ORF Transcript_39549/g.35340 Transcript_39549/m.35340 type:complete len:110 (-) Transcript_39549:175-504(-)